MIAFVLLIWGPVDPLWIRVAYLVAIPTAAWFLLNRIWAFWRPDEVAEDRLRRTIAGVIAGVLLVGAVLAMQGKYHLACRGRVVNVDGTECVGDEVEVPGPDRGEVALLAAGAAFAIWRGIAK